MRIRRYLICVWAMAALFVGMSGHVYAADSDVPLSQLSKSPGITPRNAALIDSLVQRMAVAKSARDSLGIMYDIFDLSPVSLRGKTVHMLYDAAVAADDTAARLDALRLSANLWHGNDSVQGTFMLAAEMMPVSPDQKETVTFIKLCRALTIMQTLSDDALRRAQHNTILSYDADRKVDLYRRIEVLFTICTFLQNTPSSQLLGEYIRELQTLIDRLPDASGPIRSSFYLMAAMTYTKAGHQAQAVAADRELLKITHALEKKHHAKGRKFRNYDTNFYTIYARMLGNNEALNEAEVDSLYAQLQKIAGRNPDVRNDMNSLHIVEGYYAYAKGDYRRALSELQTAYTIQKNVHRRMLILRKIIDAAKHTGDRGALIRAYDDYVPMLEESMRNSDTDRMMEYEILHDINALEDNAASLKLAQLRSENEYEDRIRLMLIVGGIILIFALLVTVIMCRRARRLVTSLQTANKNIAEERDNLRKVQESLIQARDAARTAERQKSDVVNVISHEISEPANAILGYSQLIVDSVDGKLRSTMDRFVNIISTNAETLKSLVSDMLDLAELENSRVVLKRRTASLNEIANAASESIRTHLNPGVTLTVKPHIPADADELICTDTSRVQQVLGNILHNAAKFTEQGSITLQYGREGDEAWFVVTDTGPGIPADKAEEIFNRFVKFGNRNGVGLGLHICRLVAEILGGRVFLDTAYTGGARFVFTLPIAPTDELIRPIAKQ